MSRDPMIHPPALALWEDSATAASYFGGGGRARVQKPCVDGRAGAHLTARREKTGRHKYRRRTPAVPGHA